MHAGRHESPRAFLRTCPIRTNFQDALELAGLGWSIFPLHTWNVDKCDCNKADCSNPAKHPRTLHGLSDATTNLEQIATWWEMWPAANIGVRTGAVSGLVVVDIDPRHGGGDSWVTLMREHHYEHAGPICLTGSGGMHLYFAHPNQETRNSAGAIAEGIDVRGDGGYVIAPPSVHALGTSYAWVEGFAPWEKIPQPLPTWLLEAMLASPKARAGGDVRDAGTKIPSGKRNSVMASIGGSMRQYGLGETAIFNALMAENEERCDPPLDAREVAKIAASVARYEPSAAIILPSTPNKQKAKARTPEPFTMAELEFEEIEPVKWAIPGFLPEGLAILAGKAKLGKSWMTLNLFIAMGRGEKALDYFDVPVGDGLYLALEDTKRRLKNRLRILLPAGHWPERIWMEVAWPLADDGGMEAIEAWLGQHPEARLVVIDTFQKFKPSGEGKRADVYAADYAAVGQVKEVADRYGVCIVLITHLNKGEHEDWVNNITGSTGISGAADTLLQLDRPRQVTGQGEAIILLTGRDVEEKSWGAKLDRGEWRILGELDEVQKAREYDETRKDMRLMWQDGTREVTAANMAKFTGKRVATCQKALARAFDEGFIERVKQGTYWLKIEDQPIPGSELSDRVVTPKRLRLLEESDKTDNEGGEG